MSIISSLIHENPLTLFGITLLMGLIGGEVAKKIPFIPKISGYILVGFIIGPHVLGLVDQSLLMHSSLFIDICLGLIMFELGRNLDINWLRHDKGLLLMALLEPIMTFGFIFLVLLLTGFSLLVSLLIAILSIVTSPAVVMMVARDLCAEGAVTRRTLFLTSTNNLIGLMLFTFALPFTQDVLHFHSMTALHAVYQIAGSILLGMLIFIAAKTTISLLGKNKENQFVLYISTVIIAISLANTFALSASLCLFIYGFAARNLDRKQSFMEIDFGWFGRMFFVLLFVITGVHLQLVKLQMVALPIIGVLCARLLAKFTAVSLFAKMSSLSKTQSFSTSLALYPMGGLTIGMASVINSANVQLGAEIIPVITSVVAILNILGPIAAQYAFMNAGEALRESTDSRNPA